MINKIIIHSVTHFTTYNFRLPLIKELQRQGAEVVILGKSDEYTKLLNDEGFRTIDSGISIDGLNPIQEIKWILHLKKIFKEENPDLVHHYTPKSVIFGSIASKLSGSKTVASISGLGYAFNLPNYHPIRIITELLYYLSNIFTDQYIFQNVDDMRFFLKKKITSIKKSKLIVSSGVDIEKYNHKKCKNENDDIISFTFIGRLLYEKGIKEFLDAALIIIKNNDNVKFTIVGDIDYSSPDIMNRNELQHYLDSSDTINYAGKTKDVRPFLCKTSVFVLPSYYREGVPRSILEAMAYKKPIITVDSIGCRTTTKHNYNGLVSPKKNTNKISEYMQYFIDNQDEIDRMGENSYKRILTTFNSTKVTKKTIDVYKNLQ